METMAHSDSKEAPRSWSFYAPSYARILRTFRNGPGLVAAHHRRADCDRAVLWNGEVIENLPGRSGFVNTIVEIWGVQAYAAPEFYRPKNDDVIIDLGANLGLFARWALHCAPRARISAFEPFPENVPMLRRNVAAYGATVKVYPFAVGARSGESTMIDGGASISHQLGASGMGPKVKVVTLREALDLTGSSDIDFVKMDIEGSEHDIFAELIEPELLGRIKHIAVEYHDHLRPGTLKLVRERLAPTHREVSVEHSGQGYSLILASLKALPGIVRQIP